MGLIIWRSKRLWGLTRPLLRTPASAGSSTLRGTLSPIRRQKTPPRSPMRIKTIGGTHMPHTLITIPCILKRNTLIGALGSNGSFTVQIIRSNKSNATRRLRRARCKIVKIGSARITRCHALKETEDARNRKILQELLHSVVRRKFPWESTTKERRSQLKRPKNKAKRMKKRWTQTNATYCGSKQRPLKCRSLEWAKRTRRASLFTWLPVPRKNRSVKTIWAASSFSRARRIIQTLVTCTCSGNALTLEILRLAKRQRSITRLDAALRQALRQLLA